MAYKASDIANELLRLAENDDDLMTNMKLQKMLYYEQGFHLAYFGTPLFDEDIEAWMYGPVVPSVYNEYDKFGRGCIPHDPTKEFEMDNDEEWRLFLKVYEIYNQYSAVGLMNMTHSESPWENTPTGRGHVISHKLMSDFFRTRLSK